MAFDKITSLANPQVKHVVRLRNHKARKEEGFTIVEGLREVVRANENNVVFKELYICRELFERAELADPLVKEIAAKKISVHETTQAVFEKMSYGDRHEGLLALCAPQAYSFEDIPLKSPGLLMVVESVEKPGNLGAILRTCDGAGVSGIIICDGRTDIYNPNVIRASLGTVFSVKTVVSSNEETLVFLRLKNMRICATMPSAKTIYTSASLTDSLAIVVGSEQNGLTDFWIRHADLKVKIPMKGSADSLNVSAAAAILLYEAIRQRSQ